MNLFTITISTGVLEIWCWGRVKVLFICWNVLFSYIIHPYRAVADQGISSGDGLPILEGASTPELGALTYYLAWFFAENYRKMKKNSQDPHKTQIGGGINPTGGGISLFNLDNFLRNLHKWKKYEKKILVQRRQLHMDLSSDEQTDR